MKGICKNFKPKIKQYVLFDSVGNATDQKHCRNCKLRDKCIRKERV